MIIVKAPLRVSFVGGGTDIQSFYSLEPGAVVSTAIDKYVYVTVNRLTEFFGYKILLKYSQTEKVNSLEEVSHPLIREAMKMTGVTEGIEITSMADVPAGTGLGSSSTYTVGLLQALYAFKGEWVSPTRLAEEACRIEIDLVKEPIGKQDQYIAAFGHLRYIIFNTDETVFVTHAICSNETRDALQTNLLLFYTGLRRSASKILKKQSEVSQKKLNVLSKMKGLCGDLLNVLSKGKQLGRFGEILHENWLLKQSLVDSITSIEINEYYERAVRAGALGGKVLGAGGGGFLLFYVEPQNQNRVRAALRSLIELPIRFEQEGSRVIHFSD
jgi:D-glycero-alpha-D-manno-heptose-7-phosphate kinase